MQPDPAQPPLPPQSKQDTRPFWVRPPALLLLWLLLLTYGSLLPFNLNPHHMFEQGFIAGLCQIITAPQWRPPTGHASSLGMPPWLSDLGLNLALYIPLGILLRLSLDRITQKRPLQIALTLMGVFGVSYTLECAQALLPYRVPSLNDVLANALPGCLAGMAALHLRSVKNKTIFFCFVKSHSLRLWMSRWRAAIKNRPHLSLLTAGLCLTILLCIYAYLKTGSPIATNVFSTDRYTINLLPFGEHFLRSYDVAAVIIGSSFSIYALISLLLMLLFMHRKEKYALHWTIFSLILIAAVLQLVVTLKTHQTLDATELILALGSAAMLVGTAHFLNNTVKANCRRKRTIPVKFDRRRPIQHN